MKELDPAGADGDDAAYRKYPLVLTNLKCGSVDHGDHGIEKMNGRVVIFIFSGPGTCPGG